MVNESEEKRVFQNSMCQKRAILWIEIMLQHNVVQAGDHGGMWL